MLKIAFASNDRTRVKPALWRGRRVCALRGQPHPHQHGGRGRVRPEAVDGNENKLGAKVDFLEGCAAVFVMAIGASAIKQLVARGIPPDSHHRIRQNRRPALRHRPGHEARRVAWIDQAMAEHARPARSADRFAMQEEGWEG